MTMKKRYLGQHFLIDPSVITRIVEAASLTTEDLVVEIGPGTGELTRMLSKHVKKVIAIEIDERLYSRMKGQLAGCGNVELVLGDALDYPYETLPEFTVVANIPYYITTPLLFRLIASKQNLRSLTLTVQKEVAERIVASPGGKDYGVLSLMVQYHAVPDLHFFVSRKAFRPQPEVDSAVIRIQILQEPAVSVKDEKMFFRIIKTAFSQRRKMLSNSLASIRSDTKEWLREAGIDPDRRPETLSIGEFARLSDSLRRIA
jgi:16S rRNA (adenine1518-N6/adenine1519-N6)-dimethyltransferase